MKFIPRRRNDSKVEELKHVHLFDNLPRRQLEFIAGNLDEVTVPAGETLIREGHHNDAFWVLLDGQAEMQVAGIRSRKLAAGSFFGATSMLDGRPAVATVLTKTPIRAMVASAEQFRALEGNETIALRLMSYALERLREDIEAQQEAAKKPAAKPPAKAPAKAKAKK